MSMSRLRSCIRFLLSLAVAPLFADEPAAKPHYNLKSMTPEQIDREAAGKTRYDFEIAPEDGLVDASGRVVRADQLAAYLRQQKLDADAFFFLWIAENSAPLDTLAPTVKPLGEYGVTKVVVRARPGVQPRQSAAANSGKKTLILQGKPNSASLTSADHAPAMPDRPVELRPAPLPRGIRHNFASDESVRNAAAAITASLLDPAPSEAPILSAGVFIQSGAWKTLRAAAAFAPRTPQSAKSRIPLRGRTLELESAFLHENDDREAATHALRHVIAADGGGKLRALRADEMTHWWTFIAFDIAEPVFVLETANQHHRFVLSCAKGKVAAIDELNALPKI